MALEDNDVLIYNALDKDVRVQAFGNWFTFKPDQIKRMRGPIGNFLHLNKGYMGLIQIQDSFEDPVYRDSEEGKEALRGKKQEGIDRRVQFLSQQIHNLQVSLRQDLDKSNIKVDTHSMATDGDMDAMEELLQYQRSRADAQKEKAEKARVTLRRLQSAPSSAVNQDKKDT